MVKVYDQLYETKLDWMVRLDKYVAFIGIDMLESEGIEVTRIKLFSLEALVKGSNNSHIDSIQAIDNYNTEINFKVTSFHVYNSFLFIGGNKGEVYYYDFTNYIYRGKKTVDFYIFTSEADKVTGINVVGKKRLDNNEEVLEVYVMTESSISVHLNNVGRPDSQITKVEPDNGIEFKNALTEGNYLYVAHKKLNKIRCLNYADNSNEVWAIPFDNLKIKMLKKDSYLGVLYNDRKKGKFYFDMVSTNMEHRHKGLNLRDMDIKGVDIVEGKVVLLCWEEGGMSTFTLTELDSVSKIEELRKKNYYHYAESLARDQCKDPELLRNLYLEHANSNYDNEKYMSAIDLYIEVSNIDDTMIQQSTKHKIIDPIIIINKYKNVGRLELCKYLERLFTQYKSLFLSEFEKQKQQYKLLINYLVNHLVAINDTETLTKILQDDFVRQEIDMEKFNKICSHNKNKALSVQVFEKNRNYYELACIIIEDNDLKIKIIDILRKVTDVKDPKGVLIKKRSELVVEFIHKYFYVLQERYGIEFKDFVKEFFREEPFEEELVDKVIGNKNMEDELRYDLLHIVLYTWNMPVAKWFEEYVTICIKHANQPGNKFKTSKEIENLIDEWEKKVSLNMETIYNVCLMYNYEDGIEKMGHKTNDYMMLFEFYIDHKQFDKMVGLAVKYFKTDNNLLYMVLRNVVNTTEDDLPLHKVHTYVYSLLEKYYEAVDWVLILKITRENKKLHLNCVKELLLKSFQNEVSTVINNKQYTADKTELAVSLQEANIKMSTQAIKFMNFQCSLCSQSLETNKVIAFRCGHEYHYECIVTDEDQENLNIKCSICKNDRNDLITGFKKHYDQNRGLTLDKLEKDMNDPESDQILKLADWVHKDMWHSTRYYYKFDIKD